jgi:hypothetical protein
LPRLGIEGGKRISIWWVKVKSIGDFLKNENNFSQATAGTRLLKFASEQQQNHNIFTAESLRRCKQLSRRFYEEVMASHSVTDRGWAWAEHYLLCQYITSI